MIPFDLICTICLVLSAFIPSLGLLGRLAAIGIAAEMLLFSGVHLSVEAEDNLSMFYWLGVAAI